MKAVVKENKAYCPRCGKRNYKIIDVKESDKGAVKYIVRCQCEAEFEYYKTVKIDQEKVFTDYEEIQNRASKKEKGDINMIDTPEKLQAFMYAIMKEASRDSLMELLEEADISEKDYTKIEQWFTNFNIKI